MTVDAYLKFAAETLDRPTEEIQPYRCAAGEICAVLWQFVDQLSGPENASLHIQPVDERLGPGLDRKLEKWARVARPILPPLLVGERRLFLERLKMMLVVALANEASNELVSCPTPELSPEQQAAALVLLYIHGLELDPAFLGQPHQR